MNLNDIPALPQRQDSLVDQVHDLMRVGNRLGLYDAVDAVRQLLEMDKFQQEYTMYNDCHIDDEAYDTSWR